MQSVVLDNVEQEEPTEEEVLRYAEWLGIDPVKDRDLMWIAHEGLRAPLPDGWKPCKTQDDEYYYFNFKTGESMWDHPLDQHYKKKAADEREKKMERELSKKQQEMRKSIEDKRSKDALINSSILTTASVSSIAGSAASSNSGALRGAALSPLTVTQKKVLGSKEGDNNGSAVTKVKRIGSSDDDSPRSSVSSQRSNGGNKSGGSLGGGRQSDSDTYTLSSNDEESNEEVSGRSMSLTTKRKKKKASSGSRPVSPVDTSVQHAQTTISGDIITQRDFDELQDSKSSEIKSLKREKEEQAQRASKERQELEKQIDSLRQDWRQEVDQLRQQLQKQKSDAERDVLKMKESHLHEIDAYDQAQIKLRQELQQWKDKANAVASKPQEVDEKVKQIQTQLQQEQDKVQQLQKNLQTKSDEMERGRLAQEEVIAGLRKQMKDLEDQKEDDIALVRKQLGEETDKLRRELKKQKDDEVREAKRQAEDEQSKRIQDLRSQMEDQAEHDRLELELLEQKKEVEIRELKKQRDEEISTLKSQLQKAQEELNSLQRQSRENVASSNAELVSKYEREIRWVKEEKNKEMDNLQQLMRDEREQHEQQLKQAQLSCSKAERERAQAIENTSKLQSLLSKEQDTKEQIKSECERLKHELSDLRAVSSSSTDENRALLERSEQRHKAEIEALQNRLSRVQEDNRDLQQQVAVLQAVQAQTRRSDQTTTATLVQQGKEAERLRQENDRLRMQYEELSLASSFDSEKIKDRYRLELDSLKTQLQEALKASQQLRSNESALKLETESLRQEIYKLKLVQQQQPQKQLLQQDVQPLLQQVAAATSSDEEVQKLKRELQQARDRLEAVQRDYIQLQQSMMEQQRKHHLHAQELQDQLRQKPQRAKATSSSTPQQSMPVSQLELYEQVKTQWKENALKIIQTEKDKLEKAKLLIAEEKKQMKEKQKALEEAREEWRADRQRSQLILSDGSSSTPGPSSNDRVLRSVFKLLERQAHRVNEEAKQVNKLQKYVTERKEKIRVLEVQITNSTHPQLAKIKQDIMQGLFDTDPSVGPSARQLLASQVEAGHRRRDSDNEDDDGSEDQQDDSDRDIALEDLDSNNKENVDPKQGKRLFVKSNKTATGKQGNQKHKLRHQEPRTDDQLFDPASPDANNELVKKYGKYFVSNGAKLSYHNGKSAGMLAEFQKKLARWEAERQLESCMLKQHSLWLKQFHRQVSQMTKKFSM